MEKQNLVTINTCKFELNNKEFAQAINTILNAEATGKQSVWIIAQAYTNIIENELFSDDFDTCKEFADIMGVSTATITQYKKAVEFITTSEIFTANDISVGKAYMLSALKDDVNKFLEWLLVNDKLIEVMSDKALKTAIKEWKKENEAIDTESTESENEDENEVENEDENEVENEYENEAFVDTIKEMLNDCNKEQLEELMNYIKGMLE